MEYFLSKGDIQLSEHFMLHEFQSHVRGGNRMNRIIINLKLIELLERLFEMLDCSAIVITSGYRTPVASVAVGGYATDQHTKGNAADVVCYDAAGAVISPKRVCCAAQDLDFPGIGYGGNYTHLDVREGHWHGDETNGNHQIADFYAYFGLQRQEIAAEANDAAEADGAATGMQRMSLEEAYDYTNTCFVEYLGRFMDDAAAHFVTGLVDATMSEQEVEQAVRVSEEAQTTGYKRIFIMTEYALNTGRVPSLEEIAFWLEQPRLREIHYGIYNSDEARGFRGE